MPGANEIGRYRIEQPPLGQGGMGIVYRAFDTVTRRPVALKTLKGSADASSIKLFEKEWTILATLCHPNIVDILDIGELTESGERKPYFVMPLLPGATLDKLIKHSGHLLTLDRVVEIISQACRGLQAAHDKRVVHRDLKPSNLFVMSDDTVKIIDFGIVHLADNESRTGIKGTLPYMAPEQLELKSATPNSDIFSLGVVCYEALTGRKPFDRPTAEEMVEAIRHQMPIPVSDLNPNVNELLSRTVQKALAKQPYHRFSTAREFAEFLQRAHRNEPIELFDRTRIQPRLNRVKKALGAGDYQLAVDILNELESEGNIDSELSMLRMEGERAVRAKAVQQLLEDARTRMEEQEYPLALQKIQSVLEIDPDNIDGHALRTEIERQRSSAQIEKWHQIAQQHFQNRLFSKARQAVDEILKIDSNDKSAKGLLAEIKHAEAELIKLRAEKQQLYDSAHKAYRNGEISSALRLLERVIELGKSAPGQANTDARYLEFYERVRRERDELGSAYAEGKRFLEAGDCGKALEICNQVLRGRPGEPLFQALKIEVEELQRQQNSAAVANVHGQIEAEIDLERKFEILKQAVEQFPGEQTFQHLLKLTKERRTLVNSIVARARHYEAQRQFTEASNQWEILRSIYKNYPGLDYEIQRLSKKHEEYLNSEAKARLLEKIDHALTGRDYSSADELLTVALAEAPEDDELLRLKQQINHGAESSRRAQSLLEEGQNLASAGDYQGALDKLRSARELEPDDRSISRALSTNLVEFARSLAENDWRAALSLVEEARGINPEDPGAAGVSQLIDDQKHRERVDDCLAQARELRRHDKLEEAIDQVEVALRDWPNEARLLQLRTTLRASLQRDLQLGRTPGRPVEESTADSQEPVYCQPQPAESQISNDYLGATSLLREAVQPGGAEAERSHQRSMDAPPLRSSGPGYAENAEPQKPSASDAGQLSQYEFPPRRRPSRDDEPENTLSRLKRFLPVIGVFGTALAVGVILVIKASGPVKPPVASPSPTHEIRPSTDPVAQQRPSTPNVKSEQRIQSPVTHPPAPARVSVQFDSKPVVARVKVQGENSGCSTTPCSFQLLPGRHKYSAFAPGYEPAGDEFTVPEQLSISVLLKPIQDMKRVRFLSEPAGVSFLIDGKINGRTPTTLSLSVGQHKITVIQAGEEQEGTLKVTSEASQFIEIRPE